MRTLKALPKISANDLPMTPLHTEGDRFRGGFSFRDNVVGKPSDPQGMQLGSGWIWAEAAQPEHLLNCLTVQGFAVSPGRWLDGHKSKKSGTLTEASYLLLDYDDNLSWERAKTVGYFQRHALFAYTSHSHQQPGKGDRFRVVFALDRVVRDAKTFDMVLAGVRCLAPAGDDPAINSASLLYGNPRAEVHTFDLDNRLKVEDAYLEAAVIEAKRKFDQELALSAATAGVYTADNSVARVRRWLSAIPNTSRDTWVRVAGCLRNIEAGGHDWAYPLFIEWSEQNYEQFDPTHCEELWLSLTANPGGFSRLKSISEWFRANPDRTEIDLNSLNDGRFNRR